VPSNFAFEFNNCNRTRKGERKTTVRISWPVVLLLGVLVAALLVRLGLVDRQDVAPVLGQPQELPAGP
jgi:hypothetical protein